MTGQFHVLPFAHKPAISSTAAAGDVLTPVQSLIPLGMLPRLCHDLLFCAGPLAPAQRRQASVLTPVRSPAAAARAARRSARSPRQTWLPSMARPRAGTSAAWPKTERLLLSQGVNSVVC